MYTFTQRAGSFAMDHAHGQDPALPAFGEVIGEQFGDLVCAKSVQVQLAGDGNLNGLVIEWFGIVSHRRIGGDTMIRIALAAIVFAVAAYSAEPEQIKFTGQPGVLNGASEVFGEVFGDAGQHARAAVGVAELPLGVPVEVELIVEVGE